MRGYTVPGVRAALKKRAAGVDGEAEDHAHPGQTLEGVAPVLGLYFRALSGRNAALMPFGNRNDPEQYPDTHTTIRLPDRIGRFFSGNARGQCVRVWCGDVKFGGSIHRVNRRGV